MKKRKIIKWLVAIIIIAGLAIWAKSRWSVWFGDLPEPEYKVENKISRLLMTYGEEGEESRTFTWMCGDTLQSSILELVVINDTLHFEGKGEIYQSRSGKAAYYKTSISSLPEGLRYSYRVIHPSDTTEWYSFDILNKGGERTFVFLGDVQDDCTGVTPKIFSEIFDLYPNVDFYLFGGDVIERPMSKYWDYWFSAMKDIPCTKPILAASGNHEYLKSLPRHLEERFGLVFPYAEADKNSGNALFSIKLGDAKIMLLDSNKDFWKYFSQRAWLKEELDNTTAQWQIVTMHHPIYSTKGRFNQLMQRMVFNSIIKGRGVDLVLQGHEHAYMRTSKTGDNGELQTPVYITSHCSPKNYKVSYTSNYTKTDSGEKYYQLISYDSERIVIESYNSQHDQIDKVEILSTGEVVE